MFALEVWSHDHRKTVAACLRAEALGIEAFYYGESPTGLNLDCWTTLAALSQATDRIRLGPVITNVLPGYRNLALLGKQAATVAVLSEGRLDFRTGAGAASAYGRPWWEPFGVAYGSYAQRLADLADALPLLRRYWANERLAFTPPATVQLGFHCPPIPLTIAASGPRAMALAADVADVWETSFQTPDEYRDRAAAFPHPAKRTIRHCLEIDGFLGTTRSRADAVLRAARSQRSGEHLDAIFARALIGVPEEAAERVRLLQQAGVQRFVVALHDPLDPDAVEALAATAELVGSTMRE